MLPLSLLEGKLLAEAIETKASDRFLKDNPQRHPEPGELVDFLDLSEEIQTIRSHDSKFDEGTRLYIRKYYPSIESIVSTRNRVMHSRPLEFDDYERISILSSDLVKSHRSLWANLRTARRELERDPEFYAGLSIPHLTDDTTKILHNLPPVEFDDTGFIGRNKELAELKRALTGSYPVVTVIGEGGLGKTALALKACYDLLDDGTVKFDAIIWTSAKTSRLTVHEIEVIEGAVSSSLGLVESAASFLGRQNATSAIDDLLMHLQNNKILLVIDNLETVIDNNIRDLVRRIPNGSRILFTTRISLGAFDFPVSLSPFNRKEAATYFRQAARVWGVADLSGATQPVVESFCDRLQNNPLFIKWFIQSVKAGVRPTMLTTNPKMFLEFCLQNVFNSLDFESRRVAQVLASLNGSQTTAALTFYTDFDSISVQSALSRLLTSNLVFSERGRVAEDEDRYQLSQLARLYITRHVRPDSQSQKALIGKQNQLRSAQEEFTAKAGTDIFDLNTVFVRDRDDYIVALMLTRAVEFHFREEHESANALIEQARDLSPNYFEVQRVSAMVQIAQNDYMGAMAYYESAISLAPDRAPLRVWFGGFLSRHLADQQRAEDELKVAEKLAPSSPIVKIELARILQYQRKFDEAKERLDEVSQFDGLPARTRRVHLDLRIQNETRRAEYLVGKEQYDDALSSLECAREIYEGAPASLVDFRTSRNLNRTRRHLKALQRAFRGLPQAGKLVDFEDWLDAAGSMASKTSPEVDATEMMLSHQLSQDIIASGEALPSRGRLSQLHSNYGFVVAGTIRYFFHRGSWKGDSDFRSLGEGAIVEFDVGATDKGAVALNVRPISDDQKISPVTTSGVVEKKLASYGFIRITDGPIIFFHQSACASLDFFNLMQVGDQVDCELGLDPQGRQRALKVRSQ